jgi:hypothetical protein
VHGYFGETRDFGELPMYRCAPGLCANHDASERWNLKGLKTHLEKHHRMSQYPLSVLGNSMFLNDVNNGDVLKTERVN